MGAIEFEFQTGGERLFNQRDRLRFGRIKMFHQQFRAFDRICQRHHSGGKQVARAELARFHDHIATDHVRDEAAHLLKISNVISGQLGVGFRQLGRAHRVVTIVKLFRAQKFTGRRRG